MSFCCQEPKLQLLSLLLRKKMEDFVHKSVPQSVSSPSSGLKSETAAGMLLCVDAGCSLQLHMKQHWGNQKSPCGNRPGKPKSLAWKCGAVWAAKVLAVSADGHVPKCGLHWWSLVGVQCTVIVTDMWQSHAWIPGLEASHVFHICVIPSVTSQQMGEGWFLLVVMLHRKGKAFIEVRKWMCTLRCPIWYCTCFLLHKLVTSPCSHIGMGTCKSVMLTQAQGLRYESHWSVCCYVVWMF